MEDKKSQLDAYLENLGISDEAEDAPPLLPGVPSPSNPVVSGPMVSRPAAAQSPSPQSPAPQSPSPRSPRLVASPDAIVEDFLSGMLAHLDPGFTVSAAARGDMVAAEISGGDVGKVIGREGRTLAAVEFLANTVLAKEAAESGLRVSVDAAGYRRRHEERLLEHARRHAARVSKSGESVELDPMNASDRRVIHIALKEDPYLTTESVGEGRERRVVIKARR